MATNVQAPFAPQYGTGQTLAPTAVSASVGVNSANTLCLTNLGAVVVYVRLTAGPSTCTAADYPIPVGAQVTVSKSTSFDTLSTLAASGTGSLHVIPGEGA